MAICSLSLLGFPPLLGFLAKVPLFTSAISAGEIPLVIVLGINSAIAAFYYLRLFGAALLEKPAGKTDVELVPFASRRLAGGALRGRGCASVLVAGRLISASREAAAVPGAAHKSAEVPPAPSQAPAC